MSLQRIGIKKDDTGTPLQIKYCGLTNRQVLDVYQKRSFREMHYKNLQKTCVTLPGVSLITNELSHMIPSCNDRKCNN